MTRWNAALALACAGLCGGCVDTPAPAPPSDTLDTLPSGRISVSTNTPEWAPGEAWSLASISRAVAPAGTDFDGVVDVALHPDGRILALDRGSRTVLAFDRRGERLGDVAGPAGEDEGVRPQTLLDPYALFVDPRGRIWVADAGSRTYVTFEADGSFVGAMPSPLVGGQLPGLARISGRRLYDAGFLMSTARVDRPDASMRVLGRGVVSFFLDRVLSASDTVLFDPQPAADPPPFSPRGIATIGPRGEIWFADGAVPRLHQLSINGDTLKTVAWDADEVALDSMDLAALHGWAVDAVAASGASSEPLPSVYPVVDRIIAAEDGHLWVARRTGSLRREFEVFDPDGRRLGSLETDLDVGPGGVPPFIDREHVVGVTRHDGVPHSIDLYRIVRPTRRSP